MKAGTPAPGAWLCIADPGAISRAIAQQNAMGFGFRTPLHRAALAGELRLAELLPGGRIPAAMLAPEARPLVVVVGDDAEPVAASQGPAGFPQARRLAAWCRAALLHAAGGEEAHYQAAAEWGRTLRRVLVIECGTSREAEWRELLNAEAERRARARLPALLGLSIVARSGQAHPKMGGGA